MDGLATASARARREGTGPSWACVRASLWLLVSLVALSTQRARAGAPEQKAPPSTFEIPPAPARAKPRLALEVHGSFAGPLDNHTLCPRGVGCVLRSGGGIGGSLERRWPTGLGAFGAYDIWFLDSDSVYELGVQQAIRGGVRYTMPAEIVFHPVFDVSLGVTGYGDTFRVATMGALIEFFAGAEIELTATFGLRAGLGLRVFSVSEFRTERDNVERGRDGVFAESLLAQIGLTVM